MEMARDISIDHTKPKYSEIKCKLVLPQDQFLSEQMADETAPKKMTVMDITITYFPHLNS